ncbi:MAG: hypothetical protein VKP63_05430 [Cyanobacteriota bacterium]|nr:hypothetical protein [Cyanobacteriota bacterium]
MVNHGAGSGGLIIGEAFASRPLSTLPADLRPLATALQAHGFTVRIALPPRSDTVGQFDPRSRTFLHEATHAVQSCPAGVVRPIGWTLPLDPAVERGIQTILFHGYPTNRDAEREAFTVQGQPDAVPRLLQALRQRCRR